MLNCKKMTQTASDYHDKSLPLSRRLSILMHLIICGHCRRYYRQIKMVIGMLTRLYKNKPLSAELKQKLLQDFKAH